MLCHGSIILCRIVGLLHHELPKRALVILFKEEIKKVGSYSAQINLHQEIVAPIKIKVEAAPKEKE